MSEPGDSSREELSRFVGELRTDYEQWYDHSCRRVMFSYGLLQVVALASGFGSSLIAALADPAAFGSWAKIVLIVLPAIGALASGILLQFRVHDVLRLREDGRLGFQELALMGRRMLASADTPEGCRKALEELGTLATTIERTQAQGFFGLSKPDFVATYPPRSST